MRIVSVERGHDPRDFVLPPCPGVLSALGLLVSTLKAEFTRTCLQRADDMDIAQMASVFDALDGEATAWLDAEAVPADARQIVWSASMRYENQGFELFVPWPRHAVDAAAIAEIIAAFHRQHERLYTFAQEDTPVEIVTLRVDARGVYPEPPLATLLPSRKVPDAGIARQTVHLADGTTEAPVYERDKLGSGAVIEGPAILTQLDATTLLLPGETGEVDRFGNMLITRNA